MASVSKAPEKTDMQIVADGIANVVSGLGSIRDRATSTTAYKGVGWSPEELEALYSETSLARKAIDIPIDDMLRKWRKFDDNDTDLAKIEQFEARETELQIEQHISEALRWAAVYGGGAIIPVYQGVTDAMMLEPFDVAMMRPGSLLKFVTIDGRNIYPSGTIEQNPLMEGYLMPQFYAIAGSSARIHHSWVIRANGLPLPRIDFQRNRWWGLSRLKLLKDDINRALMVRGSLSQLLDETNLDIFSVENLAAAFSVGGAGGLTKRVEALATLKSVYRVILKDSTEKFERAQISVSGMPEILQQFYSIVAAMADIPISRFLGESAKGLNATGEGDMRNYYDMVDARRGKELCPVLDKLDAIVMQDTFGEVEDWQYSFPSLWQEPEGDKEKRLLARAQRDQIYLNLGVVNEPIVAKDLRQDKVYNSMDEAWIKELEAKTEELDAAEHEATLATHEQTINPPDQQPGNFPPK